MSSSSFRYASLAMNILEKILGTRFTLHGVEKIPAKSVLFVANHFTRSETFFIPYLIYKHTNRQVRCLADSKLFHGSFGKFLRSVGAVSTKEEKRDEIILYDLITSSYDWMIYPEGSMIKSKEIKNDGIFLNYTPYRSGPIRTGSAVLGIKSQLYRQDIIEAHQKNDKETLKFYKESLGISYSKYLNDLETSIVPVSITYYPIRPGQNKIKSLITKLVKRIPSQIAEELEIEGNILLSADIDISFGDPIKISDYINSTRATINQIPIIKSETKNNLILRYLKSKLTQDFMQKLYSDVQINFDHVFAATLFHLKEERVQLNRLKRIIYYSSILIQKTHKYRINKSIIERNLFKIFSDEPNEIFDEIFSLAINQKIISRISDDEIIINKDCFAKKYDFHEIRIENTLQVILNEFLLQESANIVVKKVTKIDDERLANMVFQEIKKCDLQNFNIDYDLYFDKQFSKKKSIGAPFYLESKCKASKKINKLSVIAVHGYKSSPQEIRELATSINGYGIKVYGVRLRGHGTAPIDMKNIKWQDWYDSVQRAYCALQNISSKIIFVGFSTGGLLSLLSTAFKAKQNNKIVAVVSINSAIKLLNIKARMVPGINLWNELLEKFSLEKGKFEYVDDVPENPDINYSRNYLKGVYELEKLMDLCYQSLEKISVPVLVIQGKKDPIVDPKSGRIIFETLSSKQKFLVEMDFSNHVIVNSSHKEEVFHEIIKFFSKQKLI